MAIYNKLISILGKINSVVEWVAINLSWIMLFIITILNIVQVFYRYVLNDALSWAEEASLWMLVWMTFAMLPVAYRKGQNISMMFFRDLLKRNRFEYILRCVFHIIVLIIAIVCLDQSWAMYKGGDRLELPALEISKAYVYMVMPPAWIMLALVVVESFFKDASGIFNQQAANKHKDEINTAAVVGDIS